MKPLTRGKIAGGMWYRRAVEKLAYMLFIPVVRSIRILLQPMVFITFPVGVEWLKYVILA